MPYPPRDLRTLFSARLLLAFSSVAVWHCGGEVSAPIPTAQRAAAVLSVTQQSKLSASDAAANDAFGGAQDLDDDTAIVGARLSDPATITDGGAAYVFVRSGTTWMQQAKIAPMDVAMGDQFGWSVAVSGNVAVIGAYLADNGAMTDVGAVYVYTRFAGTWSLQQKLMPMDGAKDDHFGQAVAVEGNRLVVGSPQADTTAANVGAVYVFDRSGGSWPQKAKLTAADADVGDHLGVSVAIEGTLIAAGAADDNPGGKTDAGGGYIFEDVGGTFNQTKLIASDGANGDLLGTSAAITGSTVILGAPAADVATKADAGAAYVYVRTGLNMWTEQAKLVAPAADALAMDLFGNGVALSGNLAVVGATGSDASGKTNAGAAYLYSRSGTTWTQTHRLLASDAAPSDGFGLVAMSRSSVLLGVPSADLPTKADAGAAYVFVATLQNGDTCASAFECASGSCVDGVCCDTACGGGSLFDCQSCIKAQTGLTSDGTCGTITSVAAFACRPPLGGCDVVEVCDGNSMVCPMDRLALSGDVCRSPVSACDLPETCNGVTAICPMDKFATAGMPCRPAIGLCDKPESCDGASGACPANGVQSAGTLCRAAAGVCDAAESCDGVSDSCPADQPKPAGAMCLPPGAEPTCDPADICDGVRRTCAARYAPRATPCGAAGLSCNGRGRCG